MEHILQFLVRHGYLLLFFWLLAEQGAIPLPSLPLLLACGALARAGRLQLPLVLLYGLAACLIADNIWFELGRRRGARVLRFICRVSLEPDSCVRTTENVFLKYGLRALLVSKFVPGLNAVAAPLAGSSGASRSRFVFFDSLGILIWISTCAAVGYVFSNQLETAADYAIRMGRGLLVLVIALPAAWIAWKYMQRRRFLKKIAVSRITAEELRDRLQSGEDLLVVDVRGHMTGEAETIPGALRIGTEELAERHNEIPRDRDIVLFCS